MEQTTLDSPKGIAARPDPDAKVCSNIALSTDILLLNIEALARNDTKALFCFQRAAPISMAAAHAKPLIRSFAARIAAVFWWVQIKLFATSTFAN